MTHEFLSIYPAKLLEYGLGVLYLLLFIPFWSYVQGGRRAVARAASAARGERTSAVLAPAARASVSTAPHGMLPVRARRARRVHAVRARRRAAGGRTGAV
jgi:hypothetical protein